MFFVPVQMKRSVGHARHVISPTRYHQVQGRHPRRRRVNVDGVRTASGRNEACRLKMRRPAAGDAASSGEIHDLGTEMQEECSVLYDHGDRLPQQPAAHRHGVREDRRRRHARFSGMGLVDVLSDGQRREHQKVFKKAARGGAGPARLRRRHGPPVPGTGQRLEISIDDFIQTHRSAAPRGLHGHRAASTTRATSTKASTRAVLHRLRGVQDREGSRRRPAARIHADARVARGEELLLPALGLPQPPLAHYAAHPDFIQPGEPSQRDRQPRRGRAEGRRDHPRRAILGHPGPVRSRPARSTSGSTRC